MDLYMDEEFAVRDLLADNPLTGKSVWYLVIVYSFLAYLAYIALSGGFDNYFSGRDS